MFMFLNGVLTSGLFKRLRVRQIFIRRLGSVTGTLPVSACWFACFSLLSLPCWVVFCANSPHVIYVRNSPRMFNPFPVFFFVVPGKTSLVCVTEFAVFMYSVMEHILTLMGILVLTMIFREHTADKCWKRMLKLKKESPAYWKPDKSRATSGFFENICGKCTAIFYFIQIRITVTFNLLISLVITAARQVLLETPPSSIVK